LVAAGFELFKFDSEVVSVRGAFDIPSGKSSSRNAMHDQIGFTPLRTVAAFAALKRV
jgi:hypothetical protein